VGASLDFIAGLSKRAPGWMSRVGLEWVHRLLQDPRRLWRRYLVRGPRFIGILWRTARLPRARRVRTVPSERVGAPAPVKD
jgi:N-acetylglucosaminyldiphosphoundecaprenol N-acetyl-beta-D-mannosaminyltransferase